MFHLNCTAALATCTGAGIGELIARVRAGTILHIAELNRTRGADAIGGGCLCSVDAKRVLLHRQAA